MGSPVAWTVLYDGACPLCTRSARAVQRAIGEKRVVLRDFQKPGTLAAYPQFTFESLSERMHVVAPEGRVFSGAEAFARLFARLPVLGWVAWLYYAPGLRRLADAVYALIARNRYRLFGRGETCTGASCRMHRA